MILRERERETVWLVGGPKEQKYASSRCQSHYSVLWRLPRSFDVIPVAVLNNGNDLFGMSSNDHRMTLLTDEYPLTLVCMNIEKNDRGTWNLNNKSPPHSKYVVRCQPNAPIKMTPVEQMLQIQKGRLTFQIPIEPNQMKELWAISSLNRGEVEKRRPGSDKRSKRRLVWGRLQATIDRD